MSLGSTITCGATRSLQLLDVGEQAVVRPRALGGAHREDVPDERPIDAVRVVFGLGCHGRTGSVDHERESSTS